MRATVYARRTEGARGIRCFQEDMTKGAQVDQLVRMSALAEFQSRPVAERSLGGARARGDRRSREAAEISGLSLRG